MWDEALSDDVCACMYVRMYVCMYVCMYGQSFSNTLTQPLEPLKLEEDIQLVFFHPDWVFRDGVSE